MYHDKVFSTRVSSRIWKSHSLQINLNIQEISNFKIKRCPRALMGGHDLLEGIQIYYFKNEPISLKTSL